MRRNFVTNLGNICYKILGVVDGSRYGIVGGLGRYIVVKVLNGLKCFVVNK